MQYLNSAIYNITKSNSHHSHTPATKTVSVLLQNQLNMQTPIQDKIMQ